MIREPTGKKFETGTVTDHRSKYADRWGGWYVTVSMVDEAPGQ